MDILIIIEHNERELYNACLLKFELEKYGYTVKIENLIVFQRETALFKYAFKKLKMVIIPWAYSDYEINYIDKNFKYNGFVYLDLQNEQILSKVWMDSDFHLPKGIGKDCYHISWSSFLKNRMVDKGIHDNKIIVSGAISTDFDVPPLVNSLMKRSEISEKFNLSKNKKWILFISSFTLINSSVSDIQQISEKAKTDFSYMQEIMINSRGLILDWIIRFLENNKSFEFIYRPHPAENADSILYGLENKFSNFHIIKEYNVSQWINVSDRINTWVSTSIVNAHFMNKSCAILRPIDVRKDFDSEILIDATFISDYELFESYNLSDDYYFPISSNIIDKYYYRDTNESCSAVLAKEVNDLIMKTIIEHKVNNNLYRIKVYKNIMIFLCNVFHLSKVLPFKKCLLIQLENNIFGLQSSIKRITKEIRKLKENDHE